MKVHQFARGFWEHEPSLTLGCKRLRPLAPKLHHHHHHPNSDDTTAPPISVTPFDLKSFIRPDSGPRKLGSPDDKREPNQVDTHPGGTRWNPTQEQIGILEMLYRGGMRTPNAQQIEQITEQLSKYGKIEGKNVFYWFQNHKARERQKQKRNSSLAFINNNNINNYHSPRSSSVTAAATTTVTISNPITHDHHLRGSELVIRRELAEEDSPYKRKCRSWTFECLQEEEKKLYCRSEEASCTTGGDKTTLELFPLHPENR